MNAQHVLALVTLLVAGQSAGAAGTAEGAPPPDWPQTCAEAVQTIVRDMSASDKADLRKVPEEDLILFHHGWGTGIRNDFGLWSGNLPLAQDCSARFGDAGQPEALHPDTISNIIIRQVWLAMQ